MLTEVEWQAVWLSLKVALWATLLNVPVGFTLAWWLTRSRNPLRHLVRTLTLIPLVVPPIVTGYVLLMIFAPNQALGTQLGKWGIQVAFDWKGAVLASWLMSLPLMVRSVMVAMEQHDWRLEQASYGLGISPSVTFRKITLPLLTPGILAGSVLAFTRGFGEFGATIALCASIPGQTQTIPLAIYNAMQQPDGDERAMRLALLCTLIALTAVALSEWLNRKPST